MKPALGLSFFAQSWLQKSDFPNIAHVIAITFLAFDTQVFAFCDGVELAAPTIDKIGVRTIDCRKLLKIGGSAGNLNSNLKCN
ncbi:hypothetical protein [Ferrimonas kyonanensis]|uniref:hypothetical protein n=1 Tax=Ferrimonas kyonanensis TaxID=364763 RepID=UPI00040233AD|nr:hypothetical protein [Ferrimonas kyonanensis]